jgi:hypothetical protein
VGDDGAETVDDRARAAHELTSEAEKEAAYQRPQ